MASQQSTADDVVEQAAGAGAVSARKMFGEYGLYCDGRFVGLICGDQLFIQPTESGRAYLGTAAEGTPYPGAKPHLLIPGDAWDDAAFLAELFRITAAALPVSAKRRRAGGAG